MKKIILLLLWCVLTSELRGQTQNIDFPPNQTLEKELERLQKSSVNTKEALEKLRNWQGYPKVEILGKEYLYYVKDSIFGELKVKVYVPKSYSPAKPHQVVLLLHGAIGSPEAEGDDIFFDSLSKKNYIVVRPLAENKKNFNWVVNRFRGKPNPTFQTLVTIVNQLKFSFNIDDDRVFAYGHSDGGDGTFALQLFKPTIFSGFIAYNSMFNNIFDTNFYILNAINRPIYAVHSNLDDLRAIEQVRRAMAFLKSKKVDVTYKEYEGFQHYDKHLNMDIPLSEIFINQHVRPSTPSSIYFETNNEMYNNCDWLTVFPKEGNGIMPEGNETSIMTYYKTNLNIPVMPYYRNGARSTAQVIYSNNTFDCTLKGIEKIELLINPDAVNLSKPVIVKINGKQAHRSIVKPDKTFLINNFKNNGDRKRLYVNSIVLEVDNNR